MRLLVSTTRAEAPLHERIDAVLAQSQVGPSAAIAGDSEFVRRVYLDLTGRIPSVEAARAFLADPAPDKRRKLIEELLASVHYGERWARHWLDVAGYADSEGYTTSDTDRAWAWKYRDYVIRALNRDKPFDQLIVEQLAGDELAGPHEGDLAARLSLRQHLQCEPVHAA